MKPVVCTHKHPMMQYSQLASRQVFAESAPFPGRSDNAKLDAPVVLQHGAESAPRGTGPAIVLHQISCCCSFGQELMIIQINKQRGGVLYV